MLAALGIASSALDLLQSLTTGKSKADGGTSTGFVIGASAPEAQQANAATAPASPLSSGTLGALLTAQEQPATTDAATSREDALADLFARLDGDADGRVSKSEFEAALGAGGSNVAAADRVFGKMDADGDGAISLDEFSTALSAHHGRGHAHAPPQHGGAADAGAGGLLQALQGATTSTTTNSDGSVTTSLTYPDGTQVTTTTPAASHSAASSYNLIERAIAREAASGTASSVSMNV